MNPKQQNPSELEDLKQSLLDRLEANKKVIVGVGSLAVILIVGLILFFTFRNRAEKERWSSFLDTALFRPMPMLAITSLESMKERATGELEAHILMNLARSYYESGEHDQALEALAELEAEHPDSHLTTLSSPETGFSLVTAFRRQAETQKSWKEQQAYDEPEVDTSRVALVETSMGAFWVGFFPELSPAHVENFVTLAKSGALNAKSVTKVTMNRVDFGGEASGDADPFNDEEPTGEKLMDPEAGRYRVRQVRGMLSNVDTGEGESPTRFTVVVGNAGYDLDKSQTLFGKVLTDRYPEMQKLDEIRNVETYGLSSDPLIKGVEKYLPIRDHPVEPIRIERVSIWSDGAIEEGHDWDTTTVVTPVEPEPSEDEGVEDDGSEDDGGEDAGVEDDGVEDDGGEEDNPEDEDTPPEDGK